MFFFSEFSSIPEIGFYAAQFTLPVSASGFSEGDDIIAFRGTDEVADGFTGWFGALGDPYTLQSAAAVDFYKPIAAASSGSVFLTGHSLGGGLAGLIASVYHEDAVIFANMAFELAAQRTYEEATANDNMYRIALRDLFYGSMTPWQPSSSDITTIAVAGEVLSLTRLAQQADQITLPFPAPVGGPLHDGELHAAALHVLLTYARAEQANLNSWIGAATPVFEALTSNDVGTAVGFGALGGEATAAEKMMMGIAYSAVDEGERPFGDTAIRSLFNDAAELSAAMASGSSSIDSDTSDLLGRALVEYAGTLAIREVQAEHNPNVANGILSRSLDGSTLSVRLDGAPWEFVQAAPQLAMPEYALSGLLTDAWKHSSGNSINEAHYWYAGKSGSSGGLFGTKAIHYQLAAGTIEPAFAPAADDLVLYVLGGHGSALPSMPERSMVLGSDASEEILGRSNIDILIGNDGADTLDGGDGDDWLAGGDGDDLFKPGAGADVIWGGDVMYGDDPEEDEDAVDHVSYAGEAAKISLSFIGWNEGSQIEVRDGSGSVDRLNQIERVTGTEFRDQFRFSGRIPAGFDLRSTAAAATRAMMC